MKNGNVFDELEWRGFIKQCTDIERLKALLGSERLTYYVGFDPTADSFHVGSLLPIMAMAHLQRYGHKPIVIVGGATALIGDPSGKSEMRRMLTTEDIERNMEGLKPQFARYLEFDGPDAAVMINNADWGTKLNYIEFLRDVGVHFRVNQMLTAECFRSRLDREEGLSFLEFNYMLLQAYDFYVLARDRGCSLQIGGDDQWSNILAGIDLSRRILKKEVYGFTFPLLVSSTGMKMGKTEKGAVWMDAARTSPYDFYQYWRNVEDADVGRFLAQLTFLSQPEVEELSRLRDQGINEAKKTLAFEVTKLCHGEEAARGARDAAQSLFEGGASATESVGITLVSESEIENGISVIDKFVSIGLATSKSEARRLIRQGGLYVNDKPVTCENEMITKTDLIGGVVKLRVGKKKYRLIKVVLRPI